MSHPENVWDEGMYIQVDNWFFHVELLDEFGKRSTDVIALFVKMAKPFREILWTQNWVK